MAEFLELSIAGANAIATLLVCLTILYWLIVIVGALDIEVFDMEIDIDADGAFVSALTFLGLHEVPVTLYLSITFLSNWAIMMIFSAITGLTAPIIGFPLMIGSLFVSLIIAKLALSPFKKMFKYSSGSSTNTKKIVGELCKPLFGMEGDKLSQAKIFFNDSEILINVKSRTGEKIPKGVECLILKKDETSNCYLVQPYDEWEE